MDEFEEKDRKIARMEGSAMLLAARDSTQVSAYIEGYISAKKRTASAAHNFYVTSLPWLHHRSDFLIATMKDLEHEMEILGPPYGGKKQEKEPHD